MVSFVIRVNVFVKLGLILQHNFHREHIILKLIQEGQVALNRSSKSYCRYMLKAGHVPGDTGAGPLLAPGA